MNNTDERTTTDLSGDEHQSKASAGESATKANPPDAGGEASQHYRATMMASPKRPRIVCYLTKYYTRGNDPTWLVPQIDPYCGMTHMMIGDMRLSDGISLGKCSSEDSNDQIQLFPLWESVACSQEHGVQVLASLDDGPGGALSRMQNPDDEEFDRTFASVRAWLSQHRFDGVDLAIGSAFSLNRATRLIERIKDDFGPNFLVTLSAPAQTLGGKPQWSRLDYKLLDASSGDKIAWYNTVFYTRPDNVFSIWELTDIVKHGWPMEKIVIRTCAGFDNLYSMSVAALQLLLGLLRTQRMSPFGGIVAWESPVYPLMDPELRPNERVSTIARLLTDYCASMEHARSSNMTQSDSWLLSTKLEPPAKYRHYEFLRGSGMNVDLLKTEEIEMTHSRGASAGETAVPGMNDVLAYHVLLHRPLGSKLRFIGSTVTDKATTKLIEGISEERGLQNSKSGSMTFTNPNLRRA